MLRIDGRFLVKGGRTTASSLTTSPLLISDVPLSFWGGIDPQTGTVIDASHPLAGQCVSDTILCLPSGRGSCTASQVLLELILRDKAPTALVMRDVDGLASVGAIIAQEIFQTPTLDIVCLGQHGYAQLLLAGTVVDAVAGRVLPNGQLQAFVGTSDPPLEDDVNENLTATSFSDEEECLLNDCTTEAERMALRVIFRYANLSLDFDGKRKQPSYLHIAQSHIDGCTYIGPGGLEFVRRLVRAGGQVKVPTTLNSVSADRQRWKALGVPEEYALNSIALGDAYLELGCQPSFTCAPYLLQNPPTLAQDIAWGESNAVVYANSCLGARTEKYADYLDICCAIAGIVPAAGVHLPEHRQPRIVLDATSVLAELLPKNGPLNDIDLLFPTLGHLCGTLSDGRVPILLGLEGHSEHVSTDHVKAFCAAFGTTASSPLIHIAGLTPEAKDVAVIQDFVNACSDAVRTISIQDLERTFELLDAKGGTKETIDLVALGNPHLSVSECQNLAQLIRDEGGGRHPNTRIIACMSRSVHAQADAHHLKDMLDFGVEFVFDTCWCMLLDEPIVPCNPKATILTNSGKYAHYGPGLTKRQFRFGSMSDCIRAAKTGVYSRRTTSIDSGSLSGASSSFLASQRRHYSSTT